MFLANYVTYIGSIIALVPPILIAFVQFESTEAAGALAALLIASRVAWIDLAEMRYSGKHVNVSPVVVLLSVAFFGWMWGVVGMLLAVPLITIVHIILGSFDRTEVLAKLMSETGV
jgi:predicted PurR-regulated permease PerM